MPTEITRMTNKHPYFYSLMGPFLAKRKIAEELGMRVWDDDNKVWFIVEDDSTVLGFGAVKLKGAVAELVSAWVRPESRGKGLYNLMLRERLRWLTEEAPQNISEVRCTCTDMSYHGLVKNGFKPIGKRGKYTQMRRGLK